MNATTPRIAVARLPPEHNPAFLRSQVGQTNIQTSYGHTFSGTIVRDQASAHFGDSYTNYHIYNTSDRANAVAKTSLTIGDALTGVMTASRRAVELISLLSNPSPTLRDMQGELISLRAILSSLQTFVNNTNSVNSERARLIELEDIVTVTTELVLLYSELETLIEHSFQESYFHLGRIYRYPRGGIAAVRLLNRLGRHKSTLSILLQILQCGNIHEAWNQSSALSARTEHELENNPALAERLRRLEPLEDGDGELTPVASRCPTILFNTDTTEPANYALAPPEIYITKPDLLSIQEVANGGTTTDDSFFGSVVAQSRVYRRVEHREIDASSICRSTRSHGWSILSGLSASQVTCVGVISLPLDDPELVSFRRLAFGSSSLNPNHSYEKGHILPAAGRRHDPEQSLSFSVPSKTLRQIADPRFMAAYSCEHLTNINWYSKYGLIGSGGTYTSVMRSVDSVHSRLLDELREFRRDCPVGIRVGPNLHTNNMMCWLAEIDGPRDTPYEGGTFRLEITFQLSYPLLPAQYRFKTKIYHPNIDEKGNISLDVLGERYKPVLTMLKMLLSISSLLDDPNIDEPLVPPIAYVYKHDRASYDETAREWTRIFAAPGVLPSVAAAAAAVVGLLASADKGEPTLETNSGSTSPGRPLGPLARHTNFSRLLRS